MKKEKLKCSGSRDCQPLWLVRQKQFFPSYKAVVSEQFLCGSAILWGGGRILWGRQTFLKRPFWVSKQLISPANRALALQPLPQNKLLPPGTSFRSLIITLFTGLSNFFS